MIAYPLGSRVRVSDLRATGTVANVNAPDGAEPNYAVRLDNGRDVYRMHRNLMQVLGFVSVPLPRFAPRERIIDRHGVRLTVYEGGRAYVS